MSNSNAHDEFPLPTMVVGGGAGKIKGGQHLRYPGSHAAGEPAPDAARARRAFRVEKVGNSTGAFSEL